MLTTTTWLLGGVLAIGVTLVAGLGVAVARDHGEPPDPTWDVATSAVLQQHGHRALGLRAHEQIAVRDAGDYAPRHRLDDTPPDIRPALALMTPRERCEELVRQLGSAGWMPRLEQVAAQITATATRWELTA